MGFLVGTEEKTSKYRREKEKWWAGFNCAARDLACVYSAKSLSQGELGVTSALRAQCE